MITALLTENYSQRSPNHWKNAENGEMSGLQKSKDNMDGRFLARYFFHDFPKMTGRKSNKKPQ
jgi:hypothetical protein